MGGALAETGRWRDGSGSPFGPYEEVEGNEGRANAKSNKGKGISRQEVVHPLVHIHTSFPGHVHHGREKPLW